MIVAAVLAATLNYAVLRAHDATARVAVAAVDVPAGQALGSGSLAFTSIRAGDALLATLLSPDDVDAYRDHVAAVTLAAGDVVRRSDLLAPSASGQQRAMSIPIEPEHAVAGRLVAGDRVDVIEVRDGRAAYVLTDAEVVHVPAADARPALAGLRTFSVTVAVDDEAALRLAAAIRAGQLEVVRSTGAAPATSGGPEDSGGQAPTRPGGGG